MKVESRAFSVTVQLDTKDLTELADIWMLADLYVAQNIESDPSNSSAASRRDRLEKWRKHLEEWNKTR